MRDEKKIGILISYISLVVGVLINLFITPMMINALSDVNYSIYKVMQSLAGPLSIFNLGISTIVARAIVQYETLGSTNEKQKRNTIALSILISVAIACIVAIVGLIILLFIPSAYGLNYSEDEIVIAKKVFSLFVASTIMHLLTDAFSGCVIGHKKFIFNSSVSLIRHLIRIALVLLAVLIKGNVVVFASVDFIISTLTFLVMACYSIFKLKEIPKLTSIKKKELISIFSFSLAILLQTVINQVNGNVDTILLGAMVSEKAVITMYTSALTIYAVYNSIVSVLSGFYLPEATALISSDANGKQLTDFVIKPGRFQSVICVGIIFGFVLFGKDFISLWIGKQYINAYYIILMLIIPVTIPLVENIAISILDASLKRIYRSTVLVVMALINVVISIFLIRWISFWGAALGTVISLILGHGVLMNIYYAKEFKMEIGRMFKSIFKGILPAGIVAAVISFPFSLMLKGTLFLFLIKCLVFVVLYAIFLWVFGINQTEKAFIQRSLSTILRRNR